METSNFGAATGTTYHTKMALSTFFSAHALGTAIAIAVLVVLLIVLIVCVMHYRKELDTKTKGSFYGLLPTGNLNTGNNNPLPFFGSEHAGGPGGDMASDTTKMQAMVYDKAARRYVSSCGVGWDPAAVAETQAGVSLGSVTPTDGYGDERLNHTLERETYRVMNGHLSDSPEMDDQGL